MAAVEVRCRDDVPAAGNERLIGLEEGSKILQTWRELRWMGHGQSWVGLSGVDFRCALACWPQGALVFAAWTPSVAIASRRESTTAL